MSRSANTVENTVNTPSDYGFFGPESITWKVFRYPTSFTVGFQRTVVTEMFEPFLLASVSDTNAVMDRPAVRYDRTLQYVSTVAFGDSETVVKASNILVNVHSHIRGKEPLSGNYYDANDPDAQLWIHLTQWHSVLLCYEIFGPGKLTEAEENQYWAECRTAAAFQTIDPESVPRNRQEMRDYYEKMRPHLAATETTQNTVEHLLGAAAFLLENTPAAFKPAKYITQKLFRKATIATLPPWMRRMAGVRQSKLEDMIIIALGRGTLRAMAVIPEPLQLKYVVELISPATAKVIAPRILGIEPKKPEVKQPQQAWDAAGKATPREQYAKLKVVNFERPQEKAPKDGGASKLQSFV